MRLLKTVLKYLFTFPQASLHKLKGIDVPYVDLVTFFRYFPLGKINSDRTVSIRYRGTPVEFFFGTLGPMAAGEFTNNDYDRLPVEGREVVDIGAAIGDTATIFVLRKAKKVIGYELNKRYFDIAQRNIELNQLWNKVSLHYCGIAARKILQSDEILGALIPDKDRAHVDEAGFCTLNEVVEKNKLSRDAVLKIDVDGYEYEILRSTEKKTLNRFSYVAMEYHYGVQDLVQILQSSGFSTEVKLITNVAVPNHPESFRNMEIGMIYAERVREL